MEETKMTITPTDDYVLALPVKRETEGLHIPSEVNSVKTQAEVLKWGENVKMKNLKKGVRVLHRDPTPISIPIPNGENVLLIHKNNIVAIIEVTE